jgi:oligoribonuclease NrnB/cAMP/cGMP phosphodiesterase (DHH superfamily)
MENPTLKIFDKLRTIDPAGKTIIITHNDLDGSGPIVILKTLFPDMDLEVRHCSNAVMSYIIKDVVVNHGSEYDNIIVTDISVNDVDLEILLKSIYTTKLVLIDHHISADNLNQYPWAVVANRLLSDSFRAEYYKDAAEDAPRSESATSLFYNYLVAKNLITNVPEGLETFVHQVATYDTWDWHYTFNRDMQFYILNEIFGIYGSEMFDKLYPESFTSKEKNDEFKRQTKVMLEIENIKKQNMLQWVPKRLQTGTMMINDKTYSIVMWVGSSYLNDVFDLMKEHYPDKDFYIINYGTGISLRTENPDINVGEFVKANYNGGGHTGAGGFKISDNMQIGYTQSVMNATFKID